MSPSKKSDPNPNAELAPDGPGPHPGPPDSISEDAMLIREVPSGVCLYRMHEEEFGPIHHSIGTGRFGTPHTGAMCSSFSSFGAVVETLGRFLPPSVISERYFRLWRISILRYSRSLWMLDLTGCGLQRVGADAALTCGRSYKLSWSWAPTLYHTGVDGIMYRARHDPDQISLHVYATSTHPSRRPHPVDCVSATSIPDRALIHEAVEYYQMAILKDPPIG